MKKLFALFSVFLFISLLWAQEPEEPAYVFSADDYALTFFKKLNETQTKLTYMNKSSSLEKVGTETIKGSISGTLFYDVKIKGMGAEVTLRYTNYCDETGWIFDGEVITTSSMLQNGSFKGKIQAQGTAPGYIIYDNVQMKKGKPSSGNYLITNSHFTDEKVSYTVFLKSKE